MADDINQKEDKDEKIKEEKIKDEEKLRKEKARQRDKLKAILPSSEELNIIIKNAINRIKEPKE